MWENENTVQNKDFWNWPKMYLVTLNFLVIRAVSEKHYYYYYYYFRLQNLFQECKFIISPSVATMVMKLLTNDIFIVTFNCDEVQQ